MLWLRNVYHLAVKELVSIVSDRILFGFLLFSFSFMIYSEATGVETEVQNANIAIVDGDHSQLSRRLQDALLRPFFKPAQIIDRSRVDRDMDLGQFTFVIDIPPQFEADLLRGRRPIIQLNIDATAMSQAGVGAGYIETILLQETTRHLRSRGLQADLPVASVSRVLFNPNLEGSWHQALNSLGENITMFTILLVGAAIIRECEHGTIEHLLVMPLRSSEVAAAKVAANGLVVLLVAALALGLTLRLVLGVPIRGSVALFLASTAVYIFGSVALFLASTAVYIFAMTSLSILLATIARTMPQFGLLAVPVFMMLIMLSGANSPLESMPAILRFALQASPTVHFVDLTQSVLFRSAGLDIIWPRLLAIAALGAVFLAIALARFRSMLAHQA